MPRKQAEMTGPARKALIEGVVGTFEVAETPGGDHPEYGLWMGDEHAAVLLNRQQIGQVIGLLNYWVEYGRLPKKGE